MDDIAKKHLAIVLLISTKKTIFASDSFILVQKLNKPKKHVYTYDR